MSCYRVSANAAARSSADFSESLTAPEELAAKAAEGVRLTAPFEMPAKSMTMHIFAAPRAPYRLRHAYPPYCCPALPLNRNFKCNAQPSRNTPSAK